MSEDKARYGKINEYHGGGGIMDNFDRAKRFFEERAYKKCGVDVDALSEGELKAALKRLLGIAADSGAMRYIVACKDAISASKTKGMTVGNRNILRLNIEDGKITAEIGIDDLVYIFDTYKENCDGEKPYALVRKMQKIEFAKAVCERLQEQSRDERDCVRWAEPIEDIFDEFFEEDQSFLKYGEIDGFTDKEIKEWEKLL